ncbi:hypothetical protein C3Y05_002315 [Aeromonas allosaccharophila]|uniref:hypothetical protein n=1 Tax=Aeromonas allosaccharophila TaxID=656 RepID=UPI001F07CEEB|nr:hypothetical protein [Aeromonas allosaccharophila]WDO02483.1 hypothetical protein C3Y05_002315 [Aeromonas allosaccharophila]
MTNGNKRGADWPLVISFVSSPLFIGDGAQSTFAVIDDLPEKGIKWGHYISAAENLQPTLPDKEPPLLSSTEKRFCPSCQRETNHVVVLVDKSFGQQPTQEQKRKAFIKDFITGWAAGPFLANMDRFERHVICENCGNKVIDE